MKKSAYYDYKKIMICRFFNRNAVMYAYGASGMRLCELREKEVINICTCTKLGAVVDLVFNECDGCVEAIVVPGPCKTWCILGSDSEYMIPFHCVKRIGDDIVLVEIDEEKFLKKVISKNDGL